MTDQLMWRTATPLWDLDPTDPGPLRRPALLRFAGDEFMQDLADSLADGPPSEGARPSFSELLAGWETWRDETSEADRIGVIDPGDEQQPDVLKLYQPTHARFYLAAANLVCRRPGLPDHRIGTPEKTSMVVRQIRTVAGRETELAWTGRRWEALADSLPTAQEERLPLVPTLHNFGGPKRRLLTALIPVGARERYEAATAVAPPAPDPGDLLTDPRLARLVESIIEPLRRLWEGAMATDPDSDSIEESFVFSVVELSDYLRRLLGVGRIFAETPPGGRPLPPTEVALRRHLADVAFGPGGLSWLAALRLAELHRPDILLDGRLPATLRLSHTDLAAAIARLARGGPGQPPTDPTAWELFSLVRANAAANPIDPDTDGASVIPPPEAGRRYVVRCIYERAGCPVRAEWVSEPSETFTMAGFFDPDAPTRDHRIALPFDTSPAGLRKFPRNVSMVLSTELRKQMAKVDGIKMGDLDDGELKDEGGFDIGMVCSLSIPIITIAALILLMIIVSLLNIVFWWIPLFKVCLPVGRNS